MRSPFVTCDALRPAKTSGGPVPWFRHNYGTVRATYVHNQLDVFVPIGSPLRAPGDGILTDYHDVDEGAGGFWIKFTEHAGTSWYFAHNLRPPAFPRNTPLAAGTEITLTGWSGNAGLGNATTPGRRTEPHVHADAKVKVRDQWYHCDPWPVLCQFWGLDPGVYKHDGIVLPFVLSAADIPLQPKDPTSAPGRSWGTRRGRDPGRMNRNVLRRLWDLVTGGIILPAEMETAWES